MTLLRPFKSIRRRTNCFLPGAQSWCRVGNVLVPRKSERLRFIFLLLSQTKSCAETFWRVRQKWSSSPKLPNMFLYSTIHNHTNDWTVWGFSPSLKTPPTVWHTTETPPSPESPSQLPEALYCSSLKYLKPVIMWDGSTSESSANWLWKALFLLKQQWGEMFCLHKKHVHDIRGCEQD